ncbi:MAG: ribonuclease H-like domain-containing protein [Theionarchaea archaeon]|nr:MAG: hypothetical protein AYK18_14425 [Theionarchaea archaeon DG-70]MBU7010021.1 ribonuclease H-like domain-containing protein [Theionarchaea archaeon]
MFRSIIALNVQETGYHFLERNRITVAGCEIHTYEKTETKHWIASSIEEEKMLLGKLKDFLESFDLQRTLIITYDGKEYDFKILMTRAMIHDINLSIVLSFQHIDLYDFLKKNTRLGVKNIFDVAYVLKCKSVGDASYKDELKMISPNALAIEGNMKGLAEYNSTLLSAIYEIFQKIKPYLFPEFKMELLDYKFSQESIFG